MSSIVVDGLNVSYGRKQVLEDVSFETRPGDVVAILGPNGVGKTTLVKSICGIKSFDSGRISIAGKDLAAYSRSDLAKHLAYVPQKAYAPVMTVFDSILVGRRPHISWAVTSEDERMVWDVIRLLSLDDLALKYMDQISGGELQKVQIARAIVQKTDVMILDEPTNNLDLRNQHMILSALRSITKETGTCSMMIMHDINLALYYSDMFILMNDGKVIASGGSEVVTPEVIWDIYGVDCSIIRENGKLVCVPEKMNFRCKEFERLFGWSKDQTD